VTTYNAYGDETRIVLSDYRFNLDPADTLFSFEIPPGVDVVYMDNP
jgi:outer membrane lipoprotein-sorting protein